MSSRQIEYGSHAGRRFRRRADAASAIPPRETDPGAGSLEGRALLESPPAPATRESYQPGMRPGINTAPLILVAEDDDEMRAMLVDALQRAGYRVQQCKSGWELLVDLTDDVSPDNAHPSFDLVISDNRMPGVTGLEVMETAEFTPGFPPAILITAFGDEKLHADALRMGAVAVLDKPFEIDVLLDKVREVLQ